jgi:hypothetical protein
MSGFLGCSAIETIDSLSFWQPRVNSKSGNRLRVRAVRRRAIVRRT